VLHVCALACGSQAAPETTTKPTPSPRCTAEEPPDELYAERIRLVREAYGAGKKAIASIDPFPADAIRTACAGVDEIVRPFCFEGASNGFGMLVVQAASGARQNQATQWLRQFDTHMQAVDSQWADIHCRGVAGPVAWLEPEQQELLAPVLSERCRRYLGEMPGFKVLLPRLESDGPAAFDAMQLDEVCTGSDADWCAFGVGRLVGNSFPGRFLHATGFCRGRSRNGCLTGVGYVAFYLFPDRIDRALDQGLRLSEADQAAYFRGTGIALRWRRRSDGQKLDEWLSTASADHRHLANRVERMAETCGVLDFGDGDRCEWPTVKPPCGADAAPETK
jgi:hypothetical protein